MLPYPNGEVTGRLKSYQGHEFISEQCNLGFPSGATHVPLHKPGASVALDPRVVKGFQRPWEVSSLMLITEKLACGRKINLKQWGEVEGTPVSYQQPFHN